MKDIKDSFKAILLVTGHDGLPKTRNTLNGIPWPNHLLDVWKNGYMFFTINFKLVSKLLISLPLLA